MILWNEQIATMGRVETRNGWSELSLDDIFYMQPQTWKTCQILGNFYDHGKLGESLLNTVQHRGKIVTNETSFVCHSNICVKLLFWTSNGQSHALLTWSECGADLFAGVYME